MKKIKIIEDNPRLFRSLSRLLPVVLGAEISEDGFDLLITDWDLGEGLTSEQNVRDALKDGAKVVIFTGDAHWAMACLPPHKNLRVATKPNINSLKEKCKELLK